MSDISQNNCSVTNSTKGKLPRLPFDLIKEAILGKNYSLSCIFIDSKRSRELNKKYRDLGQPTDILSFPINNSTGEIYIDPKTSREEAKKFDRDFENFIGFLFIHGCVHLKGMDHGSTMETTEARFREQFGI